MDKFIFPAVPLRLRVAGAAQQAAAYAKVIYDQGWSILRRLAVFLSLGMYLLPTSAMQQLLGTMPDGSQLFMETTAPQSVGSTTHEVVTVIEYGKPRSLLGYNDVRSRRDYQTIDCTERTWKHMRVVLYGTSNAIGSPLGERSPQGNIQNVRVPAGANANSLPALLVNASCDPAKSRGLPASSAPAAPTPPPAIPSVPPPTTVASTPLESQQLPPAPVPSPSPAPAPTATAPAPQPALPSETPGTPPTPYSQSTQSNQTPGEEPATSAKGAQGSIGESQAFTELNLSLRSAAWLAAYVYYDDEQLGTAKDVLAKLQQVSNSYADGGRSPAFIAGAISVQAHAVEHIQKEIDDKNALLARLGMTPVPLPEITPPPISSFRAELYQEASTQKYVLIFRGSHSSLDWVSNFWLGVDLFEIEAPHYEAARRLGESLIKNGIRPAVIGHSLGAGMAQYAGLLFGLDIVGFNPSPLPARYLRMGRKVKQGRARLFSAVEIDGYGKSGQNNMKRYDPISVGLPLLATYPPIAETVQKYLKAHDFVTAPTCVVSSPDPVLTADEDHELASIIGEMFDPDWLDAFKNGLEINAGTGSVAVSLGTMNALRSPVWGPSDNSEHAKEVAELARGRAADEVMKEYNAMASGATMLKLLGQAAFGPSALTPMGETAKSFGSALVKVERQRWMMVHYQERFARGMLAAMDEDVFDAGVTSVKCGRLN